MERTTHKDIYITDIYNHTANVPPSETLRYVTVVNDPLSETLRYVTVQQNSRTLA